MRRALLVTTLLVGCAPVTLKNDGAIDFGRYSSVYVAPLDGDGSANDRDYLVTELRASSGFARITDDPDEAVHATLLVDLDEDRGFDREEYTVYVRWELVDPDGKVVNDGRSDVSETDPFEASAEALDEIVVHYLRPYRI